MKVLLTTVAALILMVNVWYFTTTFNLYNQQNEKLRWVSSEAAVAGALYKDKEKLSEGLIVFDDVQTLSAVNTVVTSNLHLDGSRMPASGAYWQHAVDVTVYILDDDSCRVYKDGTLVKSFTFTYPYLLSVDGTSYKHTVGRPTVAVSLDAGKRHVGDGFLQADPQTIRTTAYELNTRQ